MAAMPTLNFGAVEACMLWAVTTVGFFAAARIGELTTPSAAAVPPGHLRRSPDGGDADAELWRGGGVHALGGDDRWIFRRCAHRRVDNAVSRCRPSGPSPSLT